MRIAIIGCGYVGTAAARYWREKLGWTVTATTTRPERLLELEAVADRALVVHSSDLQALTAAIQDQQAVLLSVGAPHFSAYEQTYLQSAKQLITALKSAPTVRQLLYTGSYAVYGDRDGAWVDESSALKPANRNAEILAETEQVLTLAASGCDVCVLRLGGIYGPERDLMDIFGWAAGTTLPGDGSDYSNWIHLADIVGALTFVLEQRLTGVFNLVGDDPLTRRALLEYLFRLHNLDIPNWDGIAASPRPYNARVSNAKIKTAGYQLRHAQI